MSNELDVNSTQIELSEQELEQVAGGIDIFLSGSVFEQSDELIANSTSSNASGAQTTSISKSSHTFSSAFQFIGLGFDSIGDVTKVLSGLAKLFGRRF